MHPCCRDFCLFYHFCGPFLFHGVSMWLHFSSLCLFYCGSRCWTSSLQWLLLFLCVPRGHPFSHPNTQRLSSFGSRLPSTSPELTLFLLFSDNSNTYLTAQMHKYCKLPLLLASVVDYRWRKILRCSFQGEVLSESPPLRYGPGLGIADQQKAVEEIVQDSLAVRSLSFPHAVL